MSSLRNGKDDLTEISRVFFFFESLKTRNELEQWGWVGFPSGWLYKGLESIVYVFPFNPVFHCAHPGLWLSQGEATVGHTHPRSPAGWSPRPCLPWLSCCRWTPSAWRRQRRACGTFSVLCFLPARPPCLLLHLSPPHRSVPPLNPSFLPQPKEMENRECRSYFWGPMVPSLWVGHWGRLHQSVKWPAPRSLGSKSQSLQFSLKEYTDNIPSLGVPVTIYTSYVYSAPCSLPATILLQVEESYQDR